MKSGVVIATQRHQMALRSRRGFLAARFHVFFCRDCGRPVWGGDFRLLFDRGLLRVRTTALHDANEASQNQQAKTGAIHLNAFHEVVFPSPLFGGLPDDVERVVAKQWRPSIKVE